MNQRQILFLLLVFLFSNSLAQNQDSSKIRTVYYTPAMLDENLKNKARVDTNLNYFHEYNKSFGYNFFGTSVSNSPISFYSRKFELLQGTGFKTGFYSFEQCKLTPSQVRFYNTYTPFTDIYYAQGNKEFQIIKVTHTRNINPNWNVAFDLLGSHTDGFYINQKSAFKNISVNTNYLSKNGNYRLLAVMIWNNVKMNSNGGINDTSFYRYSNNGKLTANVYLENAKQVYKEKNVYFRQYLGLKPEESKDTAKVFLVHELNYLTYGYSYKDEDPFPSYYRNIYLDSTFTSDSFHFAELSNTFFIQNRLLPESKKVNLKTGFRHSIGKISQNSQDSGFYNFTGILNLNKSISVFDVSLQSEIVLSGANASDYSFKEEVACEIGKSILAFGSMQQRLKPDYLLNQIYSNHLMWNNSFRPVSSFSTYSYFENKKYHWYIKGAYSVLQNAVYLTSNIKPAQKSTPTYHLLLQVKKELKLGKFHFDNNIALQYSNDKDVISLPLWSANNLTYFESNIPKKEMKLQVGFAVRINDAFYSDAYFAPFNLLYGQSNFLINTYPVLDAFLNVSLKRARVFVKMEHLNQGYPADPGYLMPDYPLDPRVFRFGVSWIFFD